MESETTSGRYSRGSSGVRKGVGGKYLLVWDEKEGHYEGRSEGKRKFLRTNSTDMQTEPIDGVREAVKEEQTSRKKIEGSGADFNKKEV